MLRRHGLRALTAAAAAVLATAVIAPGAAAQDGRPAASAPIAGKPVAPFEIEHALSAAPELGVPLEVRIVVRPRMPTDEIEVRVSADAGLGLDASDEVLTAASAAPDAPASWSLVVVPLEDGVQRLRVYAEARVGAERQGRSTVISIVVPSAGDAAESAGQGVRAVAPRGSDREPGEPGGGTAEPAPGGERLIRLPSSSPGSSDAGQTRREGP